MGTKACSAKSIHSDEADERPMSIIPLDKARIS